jgi:large subunit ribosomal protein L24
MNRLKKNDVAVVISGEDTGKSGKVLRIHHAKNQVVVEGVNLVYKHVRRSQQNPQGGRVQKEAPIALSNVMPYCEKCERGVKVKIEVKDGMKRRVCRSCSVPLPA